MTAFHQMGDRSENLVGELDGAGYAGVFTSPVNTNAERLGAFADKYKGSLELVLDPQLYLPQSERESLRVWDYFPVDVDTADLSSLSWWSALNVRLLDTVVRCRLDSVCSPAVIPNEFGLDYYRHAVEIANDLKSRAGCPVRQTAVVRLPELSRLNRVMEIATILSSTKADRLYLVPMCDVEPRREIGDSQWLTGLLRLISELGGTGLPVEVAFCGPEAILYWAAGAATCATGKYFNLRRFTPSRWEPSPSSGGGQLPYWFEESLMAYIREADVVRIDRLGLLSDASRRNPGAIAILEQLRVQPGQPWLGLSWRQYLHWFTDADRRIGNASAHVENMLVTAEQTWRRLEDEGILMEEPRNDGSWVRAWRIALRSYLVDW